ncbi:single-stranded DNA-binding protein [Oligella urethralis]|uniref:single-stranded DNA-binding protein n=1 Tax=Oligella urethralis TaxID=90245 RepID=UPI00288A624F|nr:single-stranded DNA-binding protein [Oligella urethralis]
MSVNKVILVGRLGADPDIRATASGMQVANLSLATNHVSKDKDGNKDSQTEWHKVIFFGRQAEVCAQYLRKGSQIYVEGRIQTRKYTDRDGIERYQTEVVGERMQMLGGRDAQQDDKEPLPEWGAKSNVQFQSHGKAPGTNEYAQAKGGSQQRQQRSESLSEPEEDLPF